MLLLSSRHPPLTPIQNCNFKDFVRLLAAFSSRASSMEQLRFLFDVYDVDGDGSVSRTDLLTLMRSRAGSQLSEEQLCALVDRALEGVPRSASGERCLSFAAFAAEFGEGVKGSRILSMKVPTL